MRITIDEAVLQKNNLTLDEFLILYLCAKDIDIKKVVDDVISKKFADKDLKYTSNAVVSNNVKELLSAIIVDSDKKVEDKADWFSKVAKSLISVYPKGKKPGTNYYWTDSPAIIEKKLKTIVSKFGVTFSEEEAVEATKRYVKSFENGDKTLMHLLKYFILKTDKATGDIKSEFLSYLANKEEDATDKTDWTTTMR